MEPEFFVSLGGKTSVSSGIVPTLDSNYWEGVVPASRSKNMKHLKFHVFYETSTEMASENRILLIQKNPMWNFVENFQKRDINIFKYPAFQIYIYAVLSYRASAVL